MSETKQETINDFKEMVFKNERVLEKKNQLIGSLRAYKKVLDKAKRCKTAEEVIEQIYQLAYEESSNGEEQKNNDNARRKF